MSMMKPTEMDQPNHETRFDGTHLKNPPLRARGVDTRAADKQHCVKQCEYGNHKHGKHPRALGLGLDEFARETKGETRDKLEGSDRAQQAGPRLGARSELQRRRHVEAGNHHAVQSRWQIDA